jgi:hypothetical protein
MGSSSKTRTTMAKRSREAKLREKRMEKQAKKEARKLASAEETEQAGPALPEDEQR